MPANLPPQYYELERAFKEELDPREKLRMAEELLRMMPKHKGTDKLQADMKSKISKLKKEIEGGGKSHGAKQVKALDHIEKEGAGQIIFIGPPNCGKSSLVDALTAAKPLIADYPYATREPLPGMCEYDTVQLQLIDTPPISTELFESYMNGLIRNADLVVLIADLESEKMIEDLQYIVEQLKERRIILKKDRSESPEDVRLSYRPTIICAHKEYEDEDGSKRKKITEIFPDFKMVATSILDEDSLELLQKTMFEALDIIRIYTKPIGHDPDYNDPIILPIGGTVEDAAIGLHKDFAKKLKFAKIWGEGKFDGQKVQSDYVLADKDILEFHM
ncbi:MAG: TGS domain-containing protein [Calditrichaeota bacterium]|nr:MAG: TGS domain-containing protein [Calditrichota bacterium]